MAAEYLTRAHLVACITEGRLVQYFDDDLDGVVADDDPNLVAVLLRAERMAETRMRRSYTHAQILGMAAIDDQFVGNVAWIAAELASERRTEFLAADGKGAYWVQYTRALQEIDMLSKANIRTVAEDTVGRLGNSGGNTTSRSLRRDDPVFAVAPGRGNHGNSGGQGGF